MHENDTIAAISTPMGEGGIGIVRVSGPDAFAIASRLFRDPSGKCPRTLKPWGIRYGVVVDAETGEEIDEVLTSAMPGPHSFTREDVVEFSCHGGAAVLSRVLEAVLKCGARLAEPGEFTRRAFLSGRIDLAQAEAVIDIIRARTDSARRLAFSNLKGGLSGKVSVVRDEVVRLLAEIEAAVDFPEEDIQALDMSRVAGASLEMAGRLREFAASARRGRVYRDGVKVVIAGRANVGKSSLLNALLGHSRAIVTDIPGTTRDAIEDWTNIDGVPVGLVDTAGMRETEDPIERLGVERTERHIDEADLVVVVIDASSPVTAEDFAVLGRMKGKDGLVALNKCDLPVRVDEGEIRRRAGNMPVLHISALDGTGVDVLGKAIARLAVTRVAGASEEALMANARQQEALERAASALEEAARGVEGGAPPDLAAIDVREALFWLDQITGRSASEDLLDKIFSEFCIGK
ncbi:MAG: tRNA uridine-5-carboxymethylaminomethyl(34) synthesis GTPase MnmE [Bacillota bacterium]